MTELTRRRLNERFESWGIYYGDMMVGGLSEINGTEGRMAWQWRCGFYPGCDGHQQSHASEDDFEEAKASFQKVWERLRPHITQAMIDECRADRDWTERKYALWDSGKSLPSFEWSPGQPAEQFMKCPCGEVFDMHANHAVVVHVPHISASRR